MSQREKVLVRQIRELDKVSTAWSNCAGELTKLLDETREENERLRKELEDALSCDWKGVQRDALVEENERLRGALERARMALAQQMKSWDEFIDQAPKGPEKFQKWCHMSNNAYWEGKEIEEVLREKG